VRIAGLIYRDGQDSIGRDMTRMLQSMKHRGPDSTGYALYRPPSDGYVMHVKLADANTPRDFEFHDRLQAPPAEVERRLVAAGARNAAYRDATEYAFTGTFDYDGDLKRLADRVEDVSGAEVLSLGHALEIVKDLGDAETVEPTTGSTVHRHARDRPLPGWRPSPTSTSPTRTRTGRIRSPTWPSSQRPAHQLPQWRRRLERAGHRFQSECDSEIIAVYLAERMTQGDSLEDAMAEPRGARRRLHLHLRDRGRRSGDGQDELAAKPLVLYESTTSSRSPPRRSRSAP
jgi:hypothetical protein